MLRYLRDYLELVLPAGLIILFDQWTKWLIITKLDFGQMWSPWSWLHPYAKFVHWSNTGAAFGMFQQFGGVFTILAIMVSLFIFYYYPRIERSEWLVRLALIMQLGGAIGNLIDRLRQGYVIDFISLGSFAVFNVADACISMGVVVLMTGMYLRDRRIKQAITAPKVDDDPANSPERLVQESPGE